MKRLISTFFFLGLTLCLTAQEPAAPPPAELILSVPAGFYPHVVTVDIQCPGGQVYFTLDGTEPTPQSEPYQKPVTIRETTVLRLLATYQDERADLREGHTYFIGEPETDFAVISIGINPTTLFHPFHGLFMLGANAVDTLWKKPGANFWSKREVTCNLEIFESDGQCVYRSPSGFRLFGGMSRLFPQKSIALVARDEYGEHRIDHEIFGKPGKKKFKFLVLRNSGSDFGKSHFRDALMTSLVEDWDLETQDNRPAHVYINGRYWGIYNIREKINRYFIDSHFEEVENDSVDIMEHRYTVKKGSVRHYRSLLRYLERHDLSEPEHFGHVAAQMEIDNFLDYQIAQIYFDNQDAGGNIRYWRPQTERGRWRWILYDTDWGFGLHEPSAYEHNSLAFHTAPNGPAWPNPPWSTFILRKLLENEDCRRRFVNRFADRLNTSFQPKQVLDKINVFHERLKPEIPRHLERWKLSRTDWNFHVNVMRTFAQERSRFVRMHLMEQFQTGAQRQLTIGSTKGGQVILNDNLTLTSDTLQGTYFERYPITMRVVAHHGYRFSHWAGALQGEDRRELTLPLTQEHTELYAVFEPYLHPLESKLVINEISPKSGDAGDWLELYNGSDERLNLAKWTLSDLKHNTFTFPAVTIEPNDYLVIAEDSASFRAKHPKAYNVIGGMNFGLNKRQESIALYSILGAMVDSISYEAPPVDSAFVLSLLLPDLNNADPQNWAFRPGTGTPNGANPYYVESRVRAQQTRWMQIGLASGVLILSLLLLILRQRKTL
ncbi:MAG: CotH kinase family protein [Phaeodactylibacter sp.]|uniref:CotH kinase family protein n=1 Tax=Phaeodactylibacter sp. TaxID=1940289 RepID=UPI0032EFEAF6